VQDRVFQQAVVVARATIKGTLVIGIVQGLLGGIGFAIFGIASAAFWGTVMAIASMLPVVGTALIWIPAVIHLLVMGETTSAIGLAVWSAVIVSNVDNVLRPILVGGDTQMPDLLVLIATFGGLSMFGGVGIILGPVIAAVSITLFQIAYETLHEPSSAEVAAQPEAVNAEQTVKSVESNTESSPVSTMQSQEGRQGLLNVNLSGAQRTELQQLVEEVEKVKAGKHKAP
jgi:predicted PurR-regulated permease PerM